MKILERIKSLLNKKTTSKEEKGKIDKIVGFSLLLFGNLVSVVAITVAWFGLNKRESNISMVTGDMDVNIKKITAYRYIYPFYEGSSEFINYDAKAVDCKVKGYVLEDHDLMYNTTKVDTILESPVSSTATITLGTAADGNINHNGVSLEYSERDLNVPAGSRFKYYLVGDSVFSGDGTNWVLDNSSAIPFSMTTEASARAPAILQNVVVPAGASFIFFDAGTIGKINSVEATCKYNTYSSISESNSAFRIVGNKLFCLQSNVYKFTFTPGQLLIETQNIREAIVSNNSLDPTQINIDYMGGSVEGYDSIDQYMPDAIFGQNTSVILDVELSYTNINRIEAGLKITRTAASSKSIYRKTGKYDNTTEDLVGYTGPTNINELNASDFYCYYSEFTSTPYANANAIWSALHLKTNLESFTRFDNITEFNTTIPCTLNTKNAETLVIEPNTATTFHCYIVIDYDYVYTKYFLYKQRLGKTYYLYRDFSFHFMATQLLEEES